MKPILSILTPTIPGRETQLAILQEKIDCQHNGEVEHLVLCDNRKRSIGAKRQALVDIAQGRYVAFVDDDDDVFHDYASRIVEAAQHGADVITFEQRAVYNGLESHVVFKLGQGDGPFTPGGITKRDAWHVCAWRRELVKDCRFLFCNYGEDKAWAVQARHLAKTTIHIPHVLHTYIHDASTTAAPEGAPAWRG